MRNICEILVTDYFKLSTGHIALIDKVDPDLDKLLNECKTYLDAANKKIRSINITGEDKFGSVLETVPPNHNSILSCL